MNASTRPAPVNLGGLERLHTVEKLARTGGWRGAVVRINPGDAPIADSRRARRGYDSAMRVEVMYQGKVQGVGFRATAKALSRGRDVTGWVRNEADGTVMVVAEGPEDEVNAFLDDLREKMGRQITNEKIKVGEERGSYNGFEIRY